MSENKPAALRIPHCPTHTVIISFIDSIIIEWSLCITDLVDQNCAETWNERRLTVTVSLEGWIMLNIGDMLFLLSGSATVWKQNHAYLTTANSEDLGGRYWNLVITGVPSVYCSWSHRYTCSVLCGYRSQFSFMCIFMQCQICTSRQTKMTRCCLFSSLCSLLNVLHGSTVVRGIWSINL